MMRWREPSWGSGARGDAGAVRTAAVYGWRAHEPWARAHKGAHRLKRVRIEYSTFYAYIYSTR